MLKVGNKQETLKLNHSLCLVGKVNQVKDIYIDIFHVITSLRKGIYCQKFSLFRLEVCK